MYKFLYCLLPFLLFASCNSRLEYNVKITRDYVFFETCYNGLSISELEIMDTVIELYPHNYKKINAYDLFRKDTAKPFNGNNLKIYLITKMSILDGDTMIPFLVIKTIFFIQSSDMK